MKTSSFRGFYSLMLITLLGVSSCDFLDGEVEPPTRVTFPSHQKIYPVGAVNTYSLRATSLPSGFPDPNNPVTGTLTMKWSTGDLDDPLTLVFDPVPLVKFTTDETIGAITTTVTQYIEQSVALAVDEGSIFLHAFDGIDPNDADKYWVDTNNEPTTRENIQVLFSPFQIEAGVPGEKGKERPFDFDVMGNCSNTGCTKVATVTGSFTVTNQALLIVSTSLGDFEAYSITYTINLSRTPSLNSVIDFRFSCAPADSTPVVASGTMFINPDIGPVMIENSCNGSTSYISTLTDTTLPLPAQN